MVALVFRGEPAAKEHRKLLQYALKRDFDGAREGADDAYRGLRRLHAIHGQIELSAMSFTQETVGQRVYQRIRGDILFGRLAPGAKLKLDQLKAQYDRSVSTLREILNRLTSERFTGRRTAWLRGVSDLASGPEGGRRLAPVDRGACDRERIRRRRIEWEARVVAAHHKLASMEDKMISGDRSETELWSGTIGSFIRRSSRPADRRR